MTTLRLFTDGACKGNPGPGSFAWAFISNEDLLVAEDSGRTRFIEGELDEITTNIRSEIYAIIHAMRWYLKYGRTIFRDVVDTLRIVTDSEWSIHAIRGDWKIKKNLDLVGAARLLYADLRRELLSIDFEHIYGHSGDYWNEYVNNKAQEVLGIE